MLLRAGARYAWSVVTARANKHTNTLIKHCYTLLYMKWKAVDMFGGIGGFRHGLENSDLNVEFVDYIDQDKYAVESYNEIFNEDHEPRDATEVKPEEMEDFNILCAGFPCQSFSIAGNRGGFDDTRGTLFFEIARIAREKLPEILLLENVKGLLSHADGQTFGTILQTLDELGYDVQWQVLNSKYHGVPQNRERVFIVANHRSISRPEVFPIREPNQRTVGESEKRRIECINPRSNHHYRIYEKHGISPTLMSSTGGGSAKHPYVISKGLGVRNQRGDIQQSTYSTAIDANIHRITEVYKSNDLSYPTILDDGFMGDVRIYKDYTPSITAHATGGWEDVKCTDGVKVRKLTPKECWRLQGFPDESFKAAQKVNSDTQLYKQAGNAVTVNVIKDIGDRLASELQ